MQLYLVRWRKSECYIGQTWTSDLLSSMLCNVNIPSLSKGQNVFSWNGRSCRWFGAKDQNFCPSESIKPNKPVNIEWISDFVCIYWVLTVKSWTCHCLMCKCTVLCYMMMLHTDSMCFWIDRCYATTSPFYSTNTYYDLFVGWVTACRDRKVITYQHT